MSKNIQLSIVVPSYHESAELKKQALDKIEQYLLNQPLSYEVVIVDDGSKNNTLEIVKEHIKNKKNFRLIENPHGGKAVTVMTGMIKSEGEIALFTDMDQATPIEEVGKLLPEFDKGYEIVIGSRQGRQGAPVLRKLAAWCFATVRNVVLGLPFSDTQCGFKAFKREATDRIFPFMLKEWQIKKASGAAVNAGFDVEMLFLAKKLGFKIAEVKVNWHHVGTEQVQIISDSLQAVSDILRIRFNDLLGKYNEGKTITS